MELEVNTEEKILNAAKEIFIKKGFAGARMQEIADLAGINKAMLHYYFRSKEKLFRKIFEEIIESQMPKILTSFLQEVSFEERINIFINNYFSMLQENPYIPIFVMSELSKSPENMIDFLGNKIKPAFKMAVSKIQEELNNSNAKNKDPRQFIMNIMAFCIYPFVAKPILQFIFEADEKEFNKLIEDRKSDIPNLVIKLLN